MTTKTIKTILFGALLLAMIIPISSMYGASAQNIQERDYVAEWQVLQKQVDELVEKQIAAKEAMSRSNNIEEILQIERNMEATALEIEALNKRIDALEQESINSMKMDADLEKKLFAAEKEITQTYTSETPVWGAYVNYNLQKVVVYIDKTHEKAEQFTKTIIQQYGNDVIEINNDIPQETACSSQTSTCRPLIGGIALARDSDPGNLAGTLGYKATDSSGNIGFVTAAHVVDTGTGNNWMRQPVSGSLVGYATEKHFGQANLDTAFVKTITSIEDDVYQSSNKVMDVTSYASASEHTPGTFLYMKGVTSGEISGTIDGVSSTGWYTTTMSPQSGDSGGPVYKKFAGAHGTFTVKLFGHMFSGAGIYTSVHAVNNNWGITPVTT